MRDRAGPEGDVNLGIPLEDALSLRFRVAAPDRDDLLGIVRLERPCLGEMRGEPLVGLLSHGAGVEHDHVGRFLRASLAEAQLFEHVEDDLLDGPLVVPREHLIRKRGAESVRHPCRGRLAPRPDDEVDVDLEIARADGHFEAVALSPGLVERACDCGLCRPEEPKRVTLWRLRPLQNRANGGMVDRVRPQPLQLPRRSRKDDGDAAVVVLEENRRRRARKAE